MNEAYKLKATLGTVTKWIHLSASDDADAMMQAIPFILDEAVTSKIWARGLIQLINPAGSVIESMEPKPEPAVELPTFSKMFSKMSGL